MFVTIQVKYGSFSNYLWYELTNTHVNFTNLSRIVTEDSYQWTTTWQWKVRKSTLFSH